MASQTNSSGTTAACVDCGLAAGSALAPEREEASGLVSRAESYLDAVATGKKPRLSDVHPISVVPEHEHELAPATGAPATASQTCGREDGAPAHSTSRGLLRPAEDAGPPLANTAGAARSSRTSSGSKSPPLPASPLEVDADASDALRRASWRLQSLTHANRKHDLYDYDNNTSRYSRAVSSSGFATPRSSGTMTPTRAAALTYSNLSLKTERLLMNRGKNDMSHQDKRRREHIKNIAGVGNEGRVFDRAMVHLLFRAFDRNRDHRLAPNEFQEGLRALQVYETAGVQDNEAAKRQLFLGFMKLVDSGDTGEVDEKEFGNMFTGKTLREVIEEAVNAGASLSDQWSTTAPTTVHIVDFGNRHGEIEAHKDAAVDQATHIIQGANAFTGGDVPRRWVDVRGWNSAISEVLQQKYDVPNGILFDSRMNQAGKIELEHVHGSKEAEQHSLGLRLDEEDEEEDPVVVYVAHVVCHAVHIVNVPFVTGRNGESFALAPKSQLDAKPPDIRSQQVNMVIIRTREIEEEDTLITVLDQASAGTATATEKHTRRAQKKMDRQRSKHIGQAPKKGAPGGRGRGVNGRARAVKHEVSAAVPPNIEMDTILDWNHSTLLADHASTSVPFMAWSIFDSVVDQLDYTRWILQEWIEKLDDEITTKDPAPYHVQHLHDLQLVLERFEKVLAPLCEDMTNFDDDQSQLSCFFKAQLLPYRKTRDELKRTYDAIKSFQHRRSSLVEVYREAKETQTNKVLYLLTTVTTIFIPAQFLTGLFGMNFEHMELIEDRNGYYWFWAILAVLTLCVVLLLRYYGLRSLFDNNEALGPKKVSDPATNKLTR